ncbi:MAG: hypothetical protein QXU49_03900 [Candidatus Caldarchaeum sp.]
MNRWSTRPSTYTSEQISTYAFNLRTPIAGLYLASATSYSGVSVPFALG